MVTNGLPVHLALTPGEAHDNRLCSVLLSALLPQTTLLADRGYDADWIRELARQQGAWAGEYSAETKLQRPDLLQPASVSCAKSRRTVLQQDQTMSRPDTTSSQPTIWRSSSSHQSAFGCALMRPRPSLGIGRADNLKELRCPTRPVIVEYPDHQAACLPG